MTAKQLYALLSDVSDEHISRAETYRYTPKINRKHWLSVAAAAACLALVVSLWNGLPSMDAGSSISRQDGALATPSAPAVPSTPSAPSTPAAPESEPSSPSTPLEQLPGLTVDGVTYLVSEHQTTITLSLPEGFVPTGEHEIGPYYQSPDHPLWVYVRQTVTTDGSVDETGTMIPIDPQPGYVRYVADWLRSADLVRLDGQLYCRASLYGDGTYHYAYGTLPWGDYDRVVEQYGIRMEADAVEGFTRKGAAAFIGHDAVPQEDLTANIEDAVVYTDPTQPDLVLVETTWHNAFGAHHGFDLYLKWEVPAQ